MQLYAFSTEPEIKRSLYASPDEFTLAEVKNTEDVQGVGESRIVA